MKDAAKILLPAIALSVMWVLVFLADTWREPLITTPLFCVLLGATIYLGRLDVEDLQHRLAIRAAALLAFCFTYVLVSPSTAYQGMFLYPDLTSLKVVGGVVMLACVALMVRPPSARIALIVLLICGLSIRIFAFDAWMVDPRMRDMLPLIVSANKALLSGDNPYAVHAMQYGSQIPLTYPPVMWLAHFPAVALSLDVRWTLLLCDVAVALGLGLPALRRGRGSGLVLVGLAAYLFSPDVHWNGIYAETQVDWAVLALLLGSVISRRPMFVAVMVGVGLLTRPFNVVVAPFVFVWLLRVFGTRTTFRAFVVSGLIAGVGYLPLVLPDPNAFYLGTVDWLLQYGPAHQNWFFGMMGFTGPLTEAGHASWVRPLQLSVVGAGLVYAVFMMRTTRHLMGVVLLVYTGFVAFNSLIWMSFWVSVCLVTTAFVAVGSDRDDDFGRAPEAWSRSPLLYAEMAGAVAVVFAGGVLLSLLAGYFDDSGRDALTMHLAERIEPGDVVIDGSGPRIAFMQTPPILPPDALPRGVRLARDPAAGLNFVADPEIGWRTTGVGPMLMPGGAARMWVVDRYGWLDDPLLEGEGIYEMTDSGTFGRYSWSLLERQAFQSLGSIAQRQKVAGAWLEGPDGGRVEGVPGETPKSFAFEGFPDWSEVHQRSCAFGWIRRTMVWAHPVENHFTVLEIPVPRRATWALLSAGIDDHGVLWDHGPAYVDIEGAGFSERLELPNQPGLRSRSVAVDGLETLQVAVSAPHVGNRHVCLDVHFWH